MTEFSPTTLREELRGAIEPAIKYSRQIDQALGLALRAHDGQFREQKDPAARKVPYVAHTVGVAKIAVSLLHAADLPDSPDDILSACLTHDILEDTSVSLGELRRATSKRTADLVLSLTKPPINVEKSRAERNRAFVEQIRNAGPTPCFIKVCDAAQNLSWPAAVPTDLLLKTIQKTNADYLQLADNPHFQSAVRDFLQAKIRQAELVSEKRSKAQGASSLRSLDESLKYAIERAGSKVLEEHDMLEILREVTGADHCRACTIDDYVAGTVVGLLADPRKSEKPAQHRLLDGELDLTTRMFDRDAVKAFGSTRVLSCPFMELGEGGVRRLLFVAVSEARSAQWLTITAMRALVSVLSERLRGRIASQVSQLAEDIASLGLQLDPGVARANRLTHASLVMLKANVEFAEFIYHTLMVAIQRLGSDKGFDIEIERTEGRVKSANSIVEKLKARGLAAFDQLDDIVGLRLVFLSKVARERFARAVIKELEAETSELARRIPVLAGSAREEDVRSALGYRALHIRFKVQAPTSGLSSIGCELQLRTIYEDAWARVSQIVLYKRRANDKRAEFVLSRLAESRDECDDLVSTPKSATLKSNP
jgi:ppGpp synthetase/RelA/SpoT-type nucleotidyltranferase